MSYVNKKTRAFREAGDVELERKRSDGRMKTYRSAHDARAWCGIIEDRRQHILELVKQGDGKSLSLGKYIPIEAIIDILLANKNADIKRLQLENEDLRNFIKSHGLKYEEKEYPVATVSPTYDQDDSRRSPTASGASRSAAAADSDDAAKRKREAAKAPGAAIDTTGQVSGAGSDAKTGSGAPPSSITAEAGGKGAGGAAGSGADTGSSAPPSSATAEAGGKGAGGVAGSGAGTGSSAPPSSATAEAGGKGAGGAAGSGAGTGSSAPPSSTTAEAGGKGAGGAVGTGAVAGSKTPAAEPLMEKTQTGPAAVLSTEPPAATRAATAADALKDSTVAAGKTTGPSATAGAGQGADALERKKSLQKSPSNVAKCVAAAEKHRPSVTRAAADSTTGGTVDSAKAAQLGKADDAKSVKSMADDKSARLAPGAQTAGAVDASGRPVGAVDASGRPTGAVDASGRPTGAADVSGRPTGATDASGRPIGAADASGRPAGAADATGRPAGAADSSGRPAGAADVSGRPAGAADASGRPAGAADVSGRPAGAVDVRSSRIAEAGAADSRGLAGITDSESGAGISRAAAAAGSPLSPKVSTGPTELVAGPATKEEVAEIMRGGVAEPVKKPEVAGKPAVSKSVVISEATPSGIPLKAATESPRLRPITKEDELAAAELLAGKSPEEQVLALKNALAAKEAFSNRQNDIADAALSQLEEIQDIVRERDELKRQLDAMKKPQGAARTRTSISGAGSTLPTGTSVFEDNSVSCKDDIANLEREIEEMKKGALSPSQEAEIIKREVEVLKKYCAKLSTIQRENQELRNMLKQGGQSPADNDEGIRAKLQKLDDVTQERDRLKLRVRQLEKELLNYGDLPEEIEAFKEKTENLDEARADRENLQRRLDSVRGLEDEVRALKHKAKKADELAKQLEGKGGIGDNKEREKYLAAINCLQKEVKNLQCKCKETEILRVERNCLKMRLEDMAHVKCDYENLLKKTKCFDALKAECILYKQRVEELEDLEDECEELRMRVDRANELETERDLLLKEIQDCECCMTNQDDEIKRLTCHINCLTQDLDKRQDLMKVKVVTMRAHLEKKDNIIAKSEQELAVVQEELRNSIQQLSQEINVLRSKTEDLERQVAEKDAALTEKENSLNNLMEKLEYEKADKQKLEEMVGKAMTGDEHLKLMLKKAKCAVKCITQKLEKHEIGDASKADAERENLLRKIKQLELDVENSNCGAERIAQLEAELRKAYDTTKKLQQSLDEIKPVMDENKSLRRHSAQLQDTAKDQISRLENENDSLARKSQNLENLCQDLKGSDLEKDKIIAGLRADLVSLQEQLEREKKLRKDLETQLSALQEPLAGGTDENVKLRKQIDVLNAEIDRLNFELENEKKNYQENLSRFREKSQTEMQTKKLEEQNKSLLDEIEKLKKEMIASSSDKSGDELKKLKQELESKSAFETENKQLKEEINKLKQELASKAKVAADEEAKTIGFNKERDELLKQIEAQKKEIADLLNKIKQPAAIEDNLTFKELEKKNKENENLRSVIENLENQIKELKNAPKVEVPKPSPELQNTVNDLTKRLEQEENRIKSLQDELKKCNQDKQSGDLILNNELLKNTIEELKIEVDRLKRENGKLKTTAAAKKASIDSGKKESDDRVKELEEQLANQKKECNNMIASLKEQYERDIKNLHQQNENSIAQLQKSQQDVLNKMNQEHDKEISGFKTELRKSEIELKRLDDLEKQSKDADSTPSKCPCQFIAQKLETLPEEISEKEPDVKKRDELLRGSVSSEVKRRKPSLSSKTKKDVCICGQFPTVLPLSQPLPPPRRYPSCTPFHQPPQDFIPEQPSAAGAQITEDKIASFKKIAELENKLMAKQKYTKHKIESLQNNVDSFKRELELERQKNNDLINRYSNQSKTVANMKVEIDLVKRESCQDKQKLQHLNLTLKKLLHDKSGVQICACSHKRGDSSRPAMLTAIPHFHTEVTFMGREENKFKHNCVMKKGGCSCSGTERSSDSFDIDE